MQSSKNKIAFIFAYRTSDIWSTPLSIVEEFKKRGWETKIYSLFGKNDEYTDDNIRKMIDSDNPDIVMYMDWGRYDSELLNKSNLPSAYWIMESGDDPQNYDKNSIKAHKFDLILTPAHDSYLKYKNNGHDVLWWTHFADTNIHTLYMGFDDLPPVRSTRGQGGSQFMDILSSLIPDKFINKNGFTGTDYGYFLNNGKIVLQNSRWKEITRRIFEGMACGRMILTDRLPDETMISTLFTEGKDIVYYDNFSDCISKINYYLSPEGIYERDTIASNGYDNVIKNHTQKQRVDVILEKYNEFKIKKMENPKLAKGFEHLAQSMPTGWHSSHPDYKLLFYKGVEVSQVTGALQVLNEEFFSQFDTIIEIGSYFGGLSLWINDHKRPDTKFISYDIDPSINRVAAAGIPIDFRIKDCFSEEGKKEIIDLIQLKGKTLLVCDGGAKNEEFKLFSKYLKYDDVIILHDFLTDDATFKRLGNFWQWPYGGESQYTSIESAIIENNLDRISNYEDFVSTFWGAFVKR
jgi:hypothetical protein